MKAQTAINSGAGAGWHASEYYSILTTEYAGNK